MSLKLRKRIADFHLSMASKLTLSIMMIVAILLISSIISIVEFRRMSTYVSDLIKDNITNINLSTELAVTADQFNTAILGVVGEADTRVVSGFDASPYLSAAGRILDEFSAKRLEYADSLNAAFQRYVAASSQLDSVIVNDFTDTREWYFSELQPVYNEFNLTQDVFNRAIQEDLQHNSVSFDESFYRSIMPAVVSVAAAAMLALLLLFFILVYYVKPLGKMLGALDSYKRFSHKYNVNFEGDDQLQELNTGIGDLIDENIILKKRMHERER